MQKIIILLLFTFGFGQNNSLRFDGINDYVEIQTSGVFESIVNEITLSAWIYMSSADDYGAIIAKRNYPGELHHFEFDVNPEGSLFFGTYYNNNDLNSAQSLTQPGLINFQQWYYVSVTFSNGLIKFYVDGNLQYEEDFGYKEMYPNNHWINIGRIHRSGGDPFFFEFDGNIKSPSIFNRVLSQNEIQESMYEGFTGDEEGLVGYWDFNEGDGTTVYDLTVNNHNGTIYGATWSTDVPTPGCTDPAATNYDETANVDDGSCLYEGCTNPGACNYNADATEDDGSCLYYDCAAECGGSSYNDNCGICDSDPGNDCVQGCDDQWGSGLELDECGVCDGDGVVQPCGCGSPGEFEILTGECDCDGNVEDCNGDCGGDAMEDMCGTCDDDSLNDCVEDCNGDWGGEGVVDECGFCNSENIEYTSATVYIDFCGGNFNGCGTNDYQNESVHLISSNGYVECWVNGTGGMDISSCDVVYFLSNNDDGSYWAQGIFNTDNAVNFNFELVYNSNAGGGLNITTKETGLNANNAMIVVSSYTESEGIFILNGEYQQSTNFSGATGIPECILACDLEWYNDGSEPVVDDCGVCGGGNEDDLGCGCFEPAPSGCDNQCGSTLEDDECGDCGGGGAADLGCGCDLPAALSYCEDTDGDSLGNPGTDTDYCLAGLPSDWVEDCTDPDPIFISIYDVPDDQGGYVFLNFNASLLDVLPEIIITHYSAWRYVPNQRGFEHLGDTPAGYFPDYTFTAPTIEISIPENDEINETEFLIRAHTSDPTVFYDSEIATGYSVDNLAPATPELSSSVDEQIVYLTWSEPVYDDLSYYTVYAGDNMIAQTTEPAFADEPGYGEYVYSVTATDVHGNISSSASATVVTGVLGDTNVDFVLNVLDVVTLINIILDEEGNVPSDYEFWASDVNDDGLLNILDIVTLIHMILDEPLSRMESISSSTLEYGNGKLSVTSDGSIAGIQLEVEGSFVITNSHLPADWELSNSETVILIYSMGGEDLTSDVLFEYEGEISVISNIIADWNGGSLEASVVSVPDAFALSPAYPNPFNPTTTLHFSIPTTTDVNISIYNMQGREIVSLVHGTMDAGYHSVVWNADAHASGVYFVKMIAGEYLNTQKLMLIK